MRLERFIQKERKRIAERLFRERLLILPKEEFLAIVKAFLESRRAQFADDCLVYTVQSILPVSADTVLRAHRAAQRRGLTAAVIFSAAPVSPEASGSRGVRRRATSFITPVTPASVQQTSSLTGGDERSFCCQEKEPQEAPARLRGRMPLYLCTCAVRGPFRKYSCTTVLSAAAEFRCACMVLNSMLTSDPAPTLTQRSISVLLARGKHIFGNDWPAGRRPQRISLASVRSVRFQEGIYDSALKRVIERARYGRYPSCRLVKGCIVFCQLRSAARACL